MNHSSIVKDNFIKYVNQIILNNKVSHAYLIEIGSNDDLFYVYQFIKMILCNLTYDELKNSNNPIISLIDKHSYPDLFIIEPDGDMIKKNQLLSLQKEFSNKSLIDSKRIYIINGADKLNKFASNTMLKFLEEPEDDIIAFLLTDNRYHVLDTILSRCQILTLKDNNIIDSFDEFDLELLKSVLNPKMFYLNYNHFINDIICDKNISKNKFLLIENFIVLYLNYKFNVNKEIDSRLINIFDSYDDKYLYKCISVIEQELPKLNLNVNYKLWLDSLFSKLIIGG